MVDDIPLHDAPERFFKKAPWDEYISILGSRESAMAEVSRRTTVDFVGEELDFHTLDVWLANRLVTIKAELIADFRALLLNGAVIATGYLAIVVDRQSIPADRWETLWPDFAGDKASNQSTEFTQVRVFERTERTTPAGDLLKRCIAWLEQRRHGDESRRKILEQQAFEHFGSALTTRIFSAAYTAVFAKSRGRPRKNSQPK